jgi:16S rRNA (guanine527-N7)-methyltransferase
VALERALEGLGVDLLDPLTARLVEGHVRLLISWNSAINLTAIRDPSAIAVEHVADSLAALPVLRAAGVSTIVDLGSGGGFPGLPLAIALPAERALLVDSVAKKARFLEVVVDALDLDARVGVVGERAEGLAAGKAREAWQAVTARAVGSLAELVELAFPLLEPGGILVAWKGPAVAEEMEPAERAIRALGGGRLELKPIHLRELEGHRLAIATKHAATPDGYPRDPAARRRRPW